MNIKTFVKENIDLPKDVWEKAKGRVEYVKNLLKNVEGISDFSFQGSYSRKTVVRPKRKDEEFDVDITANHAGNYSNNEFYLFSKRIHDKLDNNYENVSQFGAKPSKATQVTFSKEFHIDVVPLTISGEDQKVFDVIKFEQSISNPLTLTKAFNINAATHVDNSLRDTVKIIKYIRNLKGIDLASIHIDIFYSQISQVSSSYDLNVLALLRKFKNIEAEQRNPYAHDEVIKVNEIELMKLKQAIDEVIEKFTRNDFTGLKKAFTTLGATFGVTAAIASSVAAKLGSGGVHVSSDNNDN